MVNLVRYSQKVSKITQNKIHAFPLSFFHLTFALKMHSFFYSLPWWLLGQTGLATYPVWEWFVTISYCPVFLLLFLLFPTIYGGPIDLPSSKCVLSEGKTSWMQI